ncbi:family 2A encapsulin nanocompartment cargo protein cysteine desulfurase [Methylocella sp.]|uniref:family 2A encapsulin nanocompartment cargo protein cysteine desulfurase n=1 Tax=Methylocella sp. TaxID=1978226 RepID=UPI0035AE96AB
MSTPDLRRTGAPASAVPASPPPQWGGAAPSVPDPQTIALIANALFKAPPGAPVEPLGAAPQADASPSSPLPDGGAAPVLDGALFAATIAPAHGAAQVGAPPYAPIQPAHMSSPGFPSGGQPSSTPTPAPPSAAYALVPSSIGAPDPIPATRPSGYGGSSEAVPSEYDFAALPASLGDATALTRPELSGAGYAPAGAAPEGEAPYFLRARDDAPIAADARREPHGATAGPAQPFTAPTRPEHTRDGFPHDGRAPEGEAPYFLERRDGPAPAGAAQNAPGAGGAAIDTTRDPRLREPADARLRASSVEATSDRPPQPAAPNVPPNPGGFGVTPSAFSAPFGFPNAPAPNLSAFAPASGIAGVPSSAESFAEAPPSPLPEATASGLHVVHPVAHEARPEIAPAVGGKRLFDAASLRRDFPILRQYVHGKPLIWLDNAATTQKPQAVIDRVSAFYENENSNIHRAAHALAARATDAYEAAREKTRRFLNASSTNEIIFVRGTTEGINLIAQAWGRRNVKAGDEILITWLEHHANIVPWQMLCAETGATLKVAPVDDKGDVRLDEYERLLSRRTRIVSFAMVANAIGTVTPAKAMIEMAHRLGACVIADAAQAVSHMPVDVQALDCDFLVFSGHKVFGPTGIGVVYGKPAALEAMPPWQGGGNMIADVTFEKTIYQPPPGRFEAGTGNIADAVGLGAAFDYLDTIGMANIAAYEHELIAYATEGLRDIPGLRLVGCADERAGALSFVLDGCRSEDVGKALDREGIAVRSGHHCAQPILRRFGYETTVRPSFALYNTRDDIDALVAAVRRVSVNERFRAR